MADSINPVLSGSGLCGLRWFPNGIQTMSALEVTVFAGQVFGCWALGFSFGWSVTVLRSAATHV